jgi:TM2 domain-containing membrane protein YozV
MRMINCKACRRVIPLHANTCPHCYYTKKSRTVAIVLALFLGGVGAHKFYLGKAGMGVLHILFCWTLIPSLIAFIEALIYLCENEYTFDMNYGARV